MRRVSRQVALAVFASVALCQCRSEPREQPAPAPAATPVAVPQPRTEPLPRQPPLSLGDRQRWRAVLAWPASCEDAFQASHAGDDGGLMFSGQGPELSIVQVTCAAGGYQPSQVFLRLDERGPSRVVTLLAFAGFQSSDGVSTEPTSDAEVWGDAHVSADGRELSLLALARQTGDCGIWSHYAVDSEQPRLLGAAARLPCPKAPGPSATSVDGNVPRGWRPIRPSK